jgi:four helix bundle protein
MSKFRFEDLEIWKLAIEILDMCLEIAEKLEKLHLYKFAEQLRNAGLSLSNNIAEGSGSNSKREFKLFLNYSRRSCFEVANMTLYLIHKQIICENWRENLVKKLELFSKKNITFQRTLR